MLILTASVHNCIEADFLGDTMNMEQLKQKAASLPLEPGVYLMKDKSETVIYVGKAKKLRNRVSQYFQENISHSPKTRLMVSKVDHFDVIVAASEFEALVLECSLIKRYTPKYNILLKDDKGYPFIRLDVKKPYPTLTLASKIMNDGAEYYGPFGSRGSTQELIDSIRQSLKLPSCSKTFPRDIGKGRVCLNYHMNQCAGWCQNNKTCQEYQSLISDVKHLLNGNFKVVTANIKDQMTRAAESLNFELAAILRDRLKALELLGQKQLVTAGAKSDMDVIGFAQTESKACFTVLHFSGGNLLDKEFEVLSAVDDPNEAVLTLVRQFYLSRGYMPGTILLPFSSDELPLTQQFLAQKFEKKVVLHVPQRGDKLRLIELAIKNATEEAQRVTSKEEKLVGSLNMLGKMLTLDTPKRIESFDISNISGTDMVASMVVYVDGKPKRSDYKRFKIKDLDGQNDYASMHQVILRRFTHLSDADSSFSQLPSIILVDGGVEHARTAVAALQSLNVAVPVFGMVKDDRHRTRALVTPDGAVINIDGNQSVFSLIGSIQEETHRFAITYHKKLRSKRLRYSELDTIEGIGTVRKEQLLKQFKSINAISNASLYELEQYLPRNAALAVYKHFHKETEE